MPTLKEKREEYAAKAATQHKVFEEAGDKLDFDAVKVIEGTTVEKVAKLNAMNDELADLVDEIKTLETIEQGKTIADEAEAYIKASEAGRPFFPAAGATPAEDAKSLGEMFIEENVGTERKGAPVEFADYDVKTLFERTAGWAPESLRTGRVVLDAQSPATALDFVRSE